jgi:hypothetical protein
VIGHVEMATRGIFAPFTMLLFWEKPITIYQPIFVGVGPNNLKPKTFQ